MTTRKHTTFYGAQQRIDTDEFKAWLGLMGFTQAKDTSGATYSCMNHRGTFCRVTLSLMIKVEWTPVHPNHDRVSYSYVSPANALNDIREGLEEAHDGSIR